MIFWLGIGVRGGVQSATAPARLVIDTLLRLLLKFATCQVWWNAREENDRAWKVPAAELLANGCNLDRKNPRAKEDIAHLPPEQLIESVLRKEQRISEVVGDIKALLAQGA